jgi:hypothetical protein
MVLSILVIISPIVSYCDCDCGLIVMFGWLGILWLLIEIQFIVCLRCSWTQQAKRGLRLTATGRDTANRQSPTEEYLRSLFSDRRSRESKPFATTVSIRQHSRLLNGLRMRQLPHSDLIVSELGIGTLTFGEQTRQEEAFAMLDLAVKEYGINLIVSYQ